MSFCSNCTNSSHKSGWMEGEIVGSKPTWCICKIPTKKVIVSSVDEFSMQNMYSCFIPYSYRSMTSIQHINSFFIYYTLKFEIQFFEWVFQIVLKTKLGAEPFFQNVRFNPVFDRLSPVLRVFTGSDWPLVPGWTGRTGRYGPVFKT